ncbi:MAG TPA: ABC transporter ATP-binding protein [Pyrinomonadaceae bacterium]|nr:ABC transporter ATP-binding protein [Pyrinomonadaceae bacterium]
MDFGLRVTDLRKSFLSPTDERIEVLRGASFSANAGEAIAITGASGAGKSTLLHLLGGLEAADHGSIVAGEFAIDRARPTALARFRNQHVGFVFQFHHLLPDLTAAENVSLPLRIKRTSPREALRRAEALLAEVGLDSRSSASLVGYLSGGEQQRVAVCRALITRPGLVLADEPTGNLDMTIGDEIARSLVSYARDNGAIVIIATHNTALVEICDHTLVLKEGRLLSEPPA